MSADGVVYVRGMYESESEEEVEEDIWDDRKLNDAYDKALKMANVEVAKRIAMSTNTEGKKGASAKPKPSNHQEKSPVKTQEPKKPEEKETKIQWVEGMPCRAVYRGDGQEYEGILLSIINECEVVIKFLGYDNSEVVAMESLMPSKGKEERRIQIAEAIIEKGDRFYEKHIQDDNYNDMPTHMPTNMPMNMSDIQDKMSKFECIYLDPTSGCMIIPPNTELCVSTTTMAVPMSPMTPVRITMPASVPRPMQMPKQMPKQIAMPTPVQDNIEAQQRPKKSPKMKKNIKMNMSDFAMPEFQLPNMSTLRDVGSMEMPLPPPPPLGFPSEGIDSEDQALSSMLLSWYMSGYYTGLYQGMKRGRSNV